MLTETLVRPAAEADLSRIGEIYAHHVLHGAATFEIEAPSAAEIARRWQTLTSHGYPYLVAETGGLVAGYAYAGPYRPRPAYQGTVEDSIYLAPDHMGRGLGSLLLAQLIERCVEQRYRQMIAVIGDSGNTASIRLHEASGFRHVGVLREVGFKLGRWIDTVLMQRGLHLD
jgi:L-amino acid N-acyltransferase YncA